MSRYTLKEIPLKDEVTVTGPDQTGLWGCGFYAFNTEVSLKTHGQNDSKPAFAAVVDLCRRFERQLSRTLEGSEIYQLNNAHGETVEISTQTADVLGRSLWYCRQSEGRFDITVGAVTQLWDFQNGIIPGDAELIAAVEHVDWRTVELSTEAQGDRNDRDGRVRYFVRLRDPQAAVDVGGTAKGIIADEIIALLQRHGLSGAFVNLGGNVAVFGGKPDNSPWRIGIQDPFGKGQLIGVMPLREGSVVTSGLYERSFEHEGRLYHHILDPQTGLPVQTDLAGATVIAKTSSDGDGYSTSLFALGSKEALAFVESIPNVEVILVRQDRTLVLSSGLQMDDKGNFSYS